MAREQGVGWRCITMQIHEEAERESQWNSMEGFMWLLAYPEPHAPVELAFLG